MKILPAPIPLGTMTRFGEIGGVMLTGEGVCMERYYFMTDERGGASLMPEDVVERSIVAPVTGFPVTPQL